VSIVRNEATIAGETEGPELSARELVRAWWEDILDATDAADMPKLAASALASFRESPMFCEAYLGESMYGFIYQIGIELLSQRRRCRLSAKDVASEIDEASGATRARFAHWFERDPESGLEIRFLALTKAQALSAAATRERRGGVEYQAAALLRVAAGKLKEGETIGDRWSVGELERVFATISVEAPRAMINGKTIWDMIQEERNG